MSGPLPEVRVIHAFNTFRVGHVFRPSALYRNALLQRGWVQLVEPAPAATPVTVSPPTDAVVGITPEVRNTGRLSARGRPRASVQ